MQITDFFSLLGGVGLFLFGMTIMSAGLRDFAGNKLQPILEKATSNRFMAIFIGIAVTLLIQSSSATDIMVIGFVNSGMMNLIQAIGVIMGANIGTTITAQITAFDLATYAPFILFLGAVLYLFVKKRNIKYSGEIILGFGMLFVGISFMKSAIAPLSQTQAFADLMENMDNPIFAVLFGVAFTALLQSSSSSTVIFQTFAMQGILDYHTAVYLVIGAAIGSVTPNLIASLTTCRNGKRTAILNLLFNLFRAVILLTLIGIFPQILDMICALSPGDVGRQIANTHTIFAIFAVIVEMPFMKQLVKLSELLIPVQDAEHEQQQERSLQYMVNLERMPISMALEQTHREVTRFGRIAAKNLQRALECFFDYSPEKAEAVRIREDSVNQLNKEIDAAFADMRSANLDSVGLSRLSMMSITVTDMERLSDHAINILDYAERMREQNSSMSAHAEEELREMTADMLRVVNLSIDVFGSENYDALPMVDYLEEKVDRQKEDLVNHHIRRLMKNECDPVAGVVYTNIVTDIERCADHAYNIAYALRDIPGIVRHDANGAPSIPSV